MAIRHRISPDTDASQSITQAPEEETCFSLSAAAAAAGVFRSRSLTGHSSRDEDKHMPWLLSYIHSLTYTPVLHTLTHIHSCLTYTHSHTLLSYIHSLTYTPVLHTLTHIHSCPTYTHSHTLLSYIHSLTYRSSRLQSTNISASPLNKPSTQTQSVSPCL